MQFSFHKKTILVLACAVQMAVTSLGQHFDLIAGKNSFLNGGAGLILQLTGDLKNDGQINSSATWNFTGTASKQYITSFQSSTSASQYNTGNYSVRVANINVNNSNGIEIDINTINSGTHYFNSGCTEIKEGNYWLTNTISTPFSGNNNTSKFFVTTGHGILKRSGVSSTGSLFPVGSAAVASAYTPLTVTYTGSADTFGLRVFDNIYYSYNPSTGDATGSVANYRFVKKTWIVRKSNRTVGDHFTVRPQWNSVNEDASFTPHRSSDILIARNHDGFWFVEAAQGPATPATGVGPFTYTGTVTYDNSAIEYYPVSVSALNTVLASDAINLKAFSAGSNILLNWQISGNNVYDYFEVQKSNDAVVFNTIGRVKTTSSAQYSFTDVTANTNLPLFYRIKAVGTNNIIYSNIQQSNQANAAGKMMVYPNPANQFVNVDLHVEEEGSYSIQLLDINGKILKQIIYHGGNSVQPIYCGDIQPGTYIMRCINNRNNSVLQTSRLVIAR